MLSSELQVGIVLCVARRRVMGYRPAVAQAGYINVSTATLVEQNVSVVLIVGLAIFYGEIGQVDFTSRAFWAFFLAGAVGASLRQGFVL